jgi:hypothetical protein
MKKVPRSIRFSHETLQAAIELGLDINEIARKSVEAAVLAKSNQCPLCGTKLIHKKNKKH